MPAIRLLFLWHMHQPYYKDLVTGEYRLPWVRLHALKDYYGMVKMLEEFPEIHQTFNLVPSLIQQIQDYAGGQAQDPFLRVASLPSGELSPGERQFAVRYLFQANLEHLIRRYPRYHELWEKTQGYSGDIGQAAAHFTGREMTDLQVLSQIAWFDEFLLEEPDVRELVKKGRGYSLEDQRFVMQKQREFLGQVLPAYAAAARRGQIEISTSPFYHPILPLICDTDAGAVSHAGLPLPRQRFRHPEDAREQIARGLALHERVFGMRPRGLWPSEGSVSNEVLALAHGAGLEWVATDEGVLERSLGERLGGERLGGERLARDSQGKLDGPSAEKLYRMYRWRKDGASMNMVFRDHALSDLIGFVYSGMPARDAARDFLRRIKESAAPLLEKGSGKDGGAENDAVVPIILDGENAWEYYPQSGREFFRWLYEGIQGDPVFQPLTISESLEREPAPAELSSIVPGSWINANFDVWIGAPEDNLAWDYLSAARDFFSENAPQATARQRELAWEELLIAEGSDWNWWYGPEHHSANDVEFDHLYRKHLSNVYHALGAAPPDVLAQPIPGGYAKSNFTPQTAYISPRIDGLAGYFDWLGAATHTADRRSSAMHGKSFLLDTGYAGIDGSNLYCRLDFVETAQESVDQARLVLTIESQSQHGEPGPAHTHRLEIQVGEGDGNGESQDWKFSENGSENGSEPAQPEGIQAGVRNQSVFTCKIPFQALDASAGTLLRIRFSLWRDRLPLDALPQEGSIELKIVPESELGMVAYARP